VIRTTLLALAAALLLPACGSSRATPGPAYPNHLQRGPVLDVQVFRTGTVVSYTNTTAATLPAGRLWLNAYFSKEVPALPVGQSITLDLEEFIDEHGDRYRAGGFFSAEPPKRLVLAQLQPQGDAAPQHLIGLVVVSTDE
jgi:hypothetical protein